MVKTPNMSKAVETEAEVDTLNATPQKSINASNISAQVATLAGRDDEAISALVSDLLVKNNEVKGGPVRVLVTLLSRHKDQALTEIFPRPVAKKEDEEDTNGPREFYDAPKADKAGEVKMRPSNFYTDYWASMSAGKAQQYVLNQLALFDSAAGEAKAEEKYRQMGMDKRVNLKKKITNDKSAGRSMIRRALAVHYVMEDIKEYSDRCTITFAMDIDDDEALATSQYPLDMTDTTRKHKYRALSVGDCVRLDIAQAVADAGPKGNLYDKLIDQLKRGAKNDETNKATFDNENDAINAMIRFNNFFDLDSESGKQHFADIKAKLAKKGNDDLIEIAGTFKSLVFGIWSDPLQNRLAAILEKKMAARNKEESEAA